VDRKTFLKSLVTIGAAVPCLSIAARADSGKCGADAACESDSGAVRQFLSDFLQNEEKNLDRETLRKLMVQRGRACCRNLQFRQDLIEKSAGNVDKLVELMGKIVGAENCVRSGDTVNLVYPITKCVCGWSPQRAPMPDDPYCDCSAANNQALFEAVSGKRIDIKVVESPRRGGVHCRFVIRIA
jgi:predicted hydrocarbon binding protein